MSDTSLPQELIEARKTIDNIDAALIHILAERFRCTQKVGLIKAVHELPPADPARESVREVIRHHEDIKAAYDQAEGVPESH